MFRINQNERSAVLPSKVHSQRYRMPKEEVSEKGSKDRFYKKSKVTHVNMTKSLEPGVSQSFLNSSRAKSPT